MSDDQKHHILPIGVYLAVFFTLLFLTYVTVWAAFQDFGSLNILVAVTIAVVKATVVILFFMHLKYSARITSVVAAGGFVWLAIMISLTLSDILTRGWFPFPPAW